MVAFLLSFVGQGRGCILGDRWPDLAGRIINGRHILPLRVYYEDTDFSGLVYHASYLRWCERGRSDFVRLLGLHQKALFEGEGPGGERFFVVRAMELDFLRPALMDDVLEVVSQVEEVGAAKVRLCQTVERGDQVLFRAKVTIVLINTEGRPARISEAIKGAFLQQPVDQL